MVEKPAEHGGGHRFVSEHVGPGIETLVAGDDNRCVLVELAHQAEDVVRLLAIDWGVTDLVNDEHIAFQYPRKPEITGALNRRGFQQPHETVHSLNAHSVPAVNGVQSQADSKVGLSFMESFPFGRYGEGVGRQPH